MTERERFEAWAIEPPREWCVSRFQSDAREAAWPGQYKSYTVQCAWEAWLESHVETLSKAMKAFTPIAQGE